MRPDEVIQSERRSAAETMSETSEGTGTTSISGQSGFGSGEELRDLVTFLGLGSLDELHQERFRVDRRKLENMLMGDRESGETAATFFHKIMESRRNVVTSYVIVTLRQ